MTWKGWGRTDEGDWVLVAAAPDDKQRVRHELQQWVNRRPHADGLVLPCHVHPTSRAAEAMGEEVRRWRTDGAA